MVAYGRAWMYSTSTVSFALTNAGGAFCKDMSITLQTSIRRFLDHCRVGKRLSPHTLRAYSVDLTAFAGFAGAECPIEKVTRDTLRDFARTLFDEGGLKETTVKRRMAALKVMFHWLERDEVIDLSPFHRLDLTIRLPRRLPRALTADEIRRLLLAAEGEARSGAHSAVLLHFVIVTLFATGLRVGELAAVCIGDIDSGAGTVLVRGKGNRERKVYLPPGHAMKTFTAYARERKKMRPDHDQLLVRTDRSPETAQGLRRSLISLAERASIGRRVTPHMLRHTAATQLIEAGVDIRFVQKLLGHASIATTQIYTQVSDSSLRETLERANTVERMRRGGKGR